MLVLHSEAKYGKNWYLSSKEKSNLKRIRELHMRRRNNPNYNYRQGLTIQQMDNFFNSYSTEPKEKNVKSLTKKLTPPKQNNQ